MRSSACSDYVRALSTRTLIPLTALLEHTASNDTLSSYFKRPTLGNALLDKFIGSIPALKVKKDLLYKVRKDNNVKPLDAVAYWGRPDVVAIYESYTVPKLRDDGGVGELERNDW